MIGTSIATVAGHNVNARPREVSHDRQPSRAPDGMHTDEAGIRRLYSFYQRTKDNDNIFGTTVGFLKCRLFDGHYRKRESSHIVRHQYPPSILISGVGAE